MASLIASVQNWISPRPTRSSTYGKTPLTGPGGAHKTTFLHDYTDTHGNKLRFAMRQTLFKDHEFHKPGHAFEAPPPHRHIGQREHFTVEKGQILFKLPDAKQEKAVKAGEPTEIVPPIAAHTFVIGKDVDEDLTVVIASDEAGCDEAFFRNLYSYQADCVHQGLQPSPIQYLVLFYHHNVLLADPPILVAKLLNVVGAYLGWALGYKPSYPEYYRETESAKAR